MYLDFHFLGRSTGKDRVLNKLRREMNTGTLEPHSLSGNLGGDHYATDLLHKATQPRGVGWHEKTERRSGVSEPAFNHLKRGNWIENQSSRGSTVVEWGITQHGLGMGFSTRGWIDNRVSTQSLKTIKAERRARCQEGNGPCTLEILPSQKSRHSLPAACCSTGYQCPGGRSTSCQRATEVTQHTVKDWHETKVPFIPPHSFKAMRSCKPHSLPSPLGHDLREKSRWEWGSMRVWAFPPNFYRT